MVTLLGSQTPRLRLVPEYVSSRFPNARPLLNKVLGFELDPWQDDILTDVCGVDAAGHYVASSVLLIVPRQNGKNHVLAARQLVGLLAPKRERAIHTAHELGTAREHFRFVKRVLEDAGASRSLNLKFRDNNQEISVENLGTGSKLYFKARTEGAGRGYAGFDTLYFDEAYALKNEEMAAILPTLSAKSMDGKTQTWFTSSAGMPSSEVLARFRAQCVRGVDKWAFFEWSVPPESDITDVQNWAAANPALNLRISEEYIRTQEFQAMGAEQFGRERLGIWNEGDNDAVISPRMWSAGIVEKAPDADEASLAVEVSPDGSHVALSLACAYGADPEDTFVQVLAYEPGYDWVAPAVRELYKARKIKGLFADSRGAVLGLLPVLQREGLNPELLNMTDVQASCEGLLKGLRSGQVVHLDDQAVADVVTSAQRRPIGEIGWAWRRATELDISPLVSLTFAHYGWVRYATKKARRAVRVVSLPL